MLKFIVEQMHTGWSVGFTSEEAESYFGGERLVKIMKGLDDEFAGWIARDDELSDEEKELSL